jgi:EmrB/QacA subfamily drug resistance transporter
MRSFSRVAARAAFWNARLTDADSLAPAQRRLVLWALMVVLLLSALDQTIVSTAMPRIVEQLRGMSMYAWVTTSYLLTSTVMVPIYGKLSDLYGRKPILITGVLLFLLGSVLCGLAGEFGDLPLLGNGMMQLVIFRALQGLGGGALMTMTFAIIADLFPPRERGKFFGLFGAVFGLATVIGPFIGGFFTDHGTVTWMGYEIAGWRWVFYVNLPLGLLALFMILYRMPTLRHPGGGRVDYVGALLLVLCITPLLLALTLGGTSYAWNSPRIITFFVIAALAAIAFLIMERRTEDSILPLHLFRIKAFRVPILASFVVGMAFLGVVLFMPLYMQVVQGINATQSGLALLPLMAGMIVSSMVSGRLVTRFGRYKPFMAVGGVVLLIGVVTLTVIGPETTAADLAWRLALTGIGLGPAQNLFSLVIQNAVPVTDLGAATGMSQFSRQIGSTVGVAIFGTFLTHSLTTELPRHVPLLPGESVHTLDLGHAQSQAMDATRIRSSVDNVLKQRFAMLERAYYGDEAATADVLADTRLPEAVKAPLRDGGIRARVHEELLERASRVEAGLRSGPEGREALLDDPDLSQILRQQLANVPSRAFRDEELTQGVVNLFRASILAQEDAMATREAEASVQRTRAELDHYAAELSDQVHEGMKEAFAASIASMLKRAAWIVALGALLIFMIPELPLRSRHAET